MDETELQKLTREAEDTKRALDEAVASEKNQGNEVNLLGFRETTLSTM